MTELGTNEDLVLLLRAAVENERSARPAVTLPALGGNPRGRLQQLMAKELKLTKELAVLPKTRTRPFFSARILQTYEVGCWRPP